MVSTLQQHACYHYCFKDVLPDISVELEVSWLKNKTTKVDTVTSHKFNHKFHDDVVVGWKGNADESTLINMQWFVESMTTADLPDDLWPLYFFKLFINNCRCSHQFLGRSNKSLCTD